jgi:hypothetical protein
VELQSDDATLTDDPSVGVTLVAGTARSQPLGAALVGGRLYSNAIQYTTHPVAAPLTVPLMADADPFAIELVVAELDLTPDGSGGFDGQLHGAVRDPVTALSPQVARAFMQGLVLHPERHPGYLAEFDQNHDGTITPDEVEQSPLLANLLAPDLVLFDGGTWAPSATSVDRPHDSFSFGLQVHLTPCPSGRCRGGITDHCDDRQRDGDESDVDCGAACVPCGGGAACARPADCRSGSCTAGRCDPPPCQDRVKDGDESDVDCGGSDPACGRCWAGASCRVASDCYDVYTCRGGTCQ